MSRQNVEYTAQELADQLNVNWWNVDSAVRAARIEPTRRVGLTRLYGPAAAKAIKEAVEARAASGRGPKRSVPGRTNHQGHQQ